MSAESRERDQKLADWSDDKVAAALRDLQDTINRAIGMIRFDSSASVAGIDAAIARYGEAREKAAIDATGVWRKEIEQEIAAARLAGEKAGRDAMTAAYEQAIPAQRAADRLAGRLEQMQYLAENLMPVAYHRDSPLGKLCERLFEERDRLRREAGK